ncbi:transposase [Streptomyces tendae]
MKALQEIYNAEDGAHAEKAIKAYSKTYGAKWLKAVAEIAHDRGELLAFYDFPAEHWLPLRTTNTIESTFQGQVVDQGHPRRRQSGAAPAVVFKRVDSAHARWQAVTAPHLVTLVRAGAQFKNGVLIEREAATAA